MAKKSSKKKGVKIIKINLVYLALWIVAFIIGLNYLDKLFFAGDEVEIVNESKEVSLDQFLSGYHHGVFSKISVENWTKLSGYIPSSWDKQSDNVFSLMSLRKDIPTHYYNVLESKKPIDTSLTEMGISLTGDVIIDIDYYEEGIWSRLLFNTILPIAFLLLILSIGMRMLSKRGGPMGGMNPFSSMSNIGKLASSNKNGKQVKFSDVIGMQEVKEELYELVDFLKRPGKYHKIWAEIPRGVLLYGAPWVGKTLLAKAVAWEAGVAFFSVSGSEFMEMLVGMWASKVRALFDKARAAGKAIIFIDEIDAIGKRRGGGLSGWHQEQEQTLNQILTEMDGFDTTDNIIVLASTNRPDTLDPALLRSGRFDRKVMVSSPSKEERKKMFEYYLGKKKIHTDVSVDSIVNRSSGMVGADIENIVNEAALKAARDNKSTLDNDDLNYAIEKVVMGPERRTKIVTDEKKRLVAYHELGHAVTSYHLEHADQLERITIVPRGQSLGATWYSPDEDKTLVSKAEFLDQLVSLLGGRAAEEIFVGKDYITTWASNDFEKATKIAADMILKYGMDEEMGTIVYLDKSDDNMTNHFRRYSDKTTEMSDKKIKALIADAYDKAIQILTDNKDKIETITSVLLEKEALSKEEFAELMEGESSGK